MNLNHNEGRRTAGSIAIAIAVAACFITTTAQAVSVTSAGLQLRLQYPTTNVVNGPDRNVWVGVSQQDRNNPEYKINASAGQTPPDYPFARDYGGNIAYTAVQGKANPYGSAVVGGDGAVYFTMGGCDTFANPSCVSPPPGSIGKATQSGLTNIYQIQTSNGDASPFLAALSVGPDGNVWYSRSGGFIGKMTPSGQTTEYNIGYSASNIRNGMILGPDNNIWFVSRGTTLVKFNPSNQSTATFPLSNVPGTQIQIQAYSLAAGPDGNIWFIGGGTTQFVGGVVGKVTTGGQVTAWLANKDRSLDAIAGGPDGNVWFTTVDWSNLTDNGRDYYLVKEKAVRIDTNGTMTEYVVHTYDSRIASTWDDITMPGIITGADGKLHILVFNVWHQHPASQPWYVMQTDGYLLTPDAPTTSNDPTLTVLTSGNGNGSVRMSIGKNSTNNQQLVTLTAVTGSSSRFDGWSDTSCFGTNTTCQIVLLGDKTITASFSIPQSVKTTQYQGAVFSTTQHRSYIRLYSNQTGTATINVIDPRTSKVLRTTQTNVAGGGQVQIGLDSLLPSAPPSDGPPTYYSVNIQASGGFNGYYQHVVWDPGAGAISNLTACDSPLNSTGQLGFVHSTLLADYPSSIVITNPTDKDVAAVNLDVADNNGTHLGTYSSDTIPANSAKIIDVADLETRSGVRPSSQGFVHYIVRMASTFKGSIQHLVTNKTAGGILTDLTTVCPLSAQ